MPKFAYIVVLLSLGLSQLTFAENTCSSLFNYEKVAEADLNAVISDESSVSESAIKVAKKLEAVRTHLIKKIGPTADRKTRETNVKIMESYLRTQAFHSSLKIFQSKKKMEYDAIIVGMGPHALFALTGILSENPNARVLILAADDTAAATFREGYVFSINSSNKPSGNGGKPLPGLGNINELPGLPIQVSDITSVRYPEAADLGDALVANAYALFSTYKNNIDLVLGTEIDQKQFEKLARQKKEGPVTVDFDIPDLDGSANKTARSAKADFVITATGLGTPKAIDEFIESSRDKRDLRKIKPNGLPTVMTFQEFIRLMADSERPWDLLEDLNIKVVAPGDSGNVTMEFLLGLASQAAYGSSAVQEKVLRQIGWVGQPLETCKAFLDKIRNRYSPISSGYKSSDPSVAPPLKAYPQKLLSLSTSGKLGRTEARLFLEEGFVLDADLVILANGFDKLPADVEAQLKDLKKKTTISDGNKVLIAKTNPAGTVLITGPSVRLPTQEELTGPIQNFVSLFNNAPRSFATGKYVGRQIKTKKGVDKTAKIEIVPTNSSIRHVVTVEGIELFAGRDFVKNPYFGRINNFNISAYLKASFETVLNSFDWSTFKNGEVKIHVKRVAEGFEVITNGFANPQVVAALAYNRDFFNPLLSVLSGKTEAIQITAQVADGQLVTGSAKIYTASAEQPSDDTAQKGIKVKSRVPPYIRELYRDQEQ